MNDVLASALIFALFVLFLVYLFHMVMQKYAWQWWYHNVYLNSVHWRIKRWMKKTQCRFYHLGKVVCEKCGGQDRITIHHVTYARLWHERLSDLQVICWRCHRRGSGRI